MCYEYYYLKFSPESCYYKVLKNEIKKLFFSLEGSPLLDKVLQQYKEKYGDKSYNYAKNAFYYWTHGQKEIASSTLYKLTDIVPHFLSRETRSVLLRKVIEHCLDSYRTSFYSSTKYNMYILTWNDYSEALNKIIISIQYKAMKSNVEYYKPLPVDIVAAITWADESEISDARDIAIKTFIKDEQQKYTAAINDVKNFWKQCNAMKEGNVVFDDMTLETKVTGACYHIDVVSDRNRFLRSNTNKRRSSWI